VVQSGRAWRASNARSSSSGTYRLEHPGRVPYKERIRQGAKSIFLLFHLVAMVRWIYPTRREQQQLHE
jgi:hypothetical protein